MELQRALPALRGLGATVLGASTDTGPATRRLAARLHLAFPLLSDAHHRLGLAFHDFEVNPVAAIDSDEIVLLDGAGRIAWQRPLINETVVPGAEVIAALRRVQ